MGFRFFRRMKIAPGVTLNLSKSGPSFSFGPRGAKYTVGPCGTRKTVGIPGTGLFYTTASGFGSKPHAPDGELAETIRAAARPLLCVATLSPALRVIDVHLAHVGPLASFLAPPADIFRQAMRDRADLIALLHNHSATPTPPKRTRP